MDPDREPSRAVFWGANWWDLCHLQYLNSLVAWLREPSGNQTDEQGEEPFTGRAEVVPVASDHGPLTRPAADGLMVPERKEMRLLCSQQSLP